MHASEKTLEKLGIHPDVLHLIDRDKDRSLAAKLAFIQISLSHTGTTKGVTMSDLHQWAKERQLVGESQKHFNATWIRPLIELELVRKKGNLLALHHDVLRSSGYLRQVEER